MPKILYEKKYPKRKIDELPAAFERNDEARKQSFDDIMQELLQDTIYVLMPERKERAVRFIQTAIEVSKAYELDIKIEEHLSHLTVYFYFDCSGCMGFLKEVVALADDLAFFTHAEEYDLVLALDYYTHAVYRHGRRINP